MRIRVSHNHMRKLWRIMNSELIVAIIAAIAIPFYINYNSNITAERANSFATKMLLSEINIRRICMENILRDSVIEYKISGPFSENEYLKLLLCLQGNRTDKFLSWSGNQFEQYNKKSLLSLLVDLNFYLKKDNSVIQKIVDSLIIVPSISDTFSVFSSQPVYIKGMRDTVYEQVSNGVTHYSSPKYGSPTVYPTDVLVFKPRYSQLFKYILSELALLIPDLKV